MKIQISEWFKLKYSNILNVLIGILFTVTMIDPKNLIFHLKYLIFCLLFIVWIIRLIKTKSKIVIRPSLFLILAFISFFMPFYAITIGLLNNIINNSEFGTFIYFSSFFFFLLLLIVVNDHIALTKYINFTALIIVFITLGFYLILVINPIYFNDLYEYFVIKKEVAVYALRNYGEFTLLMMFYKTSPILVFPLSYYLYRIIITSNKKRLLTDCIALFLIIVTLFLSGTRANVFSLILIVIFYLGYYIYKKTKEGFALLIISSIIFALITIPIIYNLLFNQNESSNIEKFGHIISYFNQFEDHKIMAIFGQGIGGMFFSTGIDSLTYATELSYLELVRIWGFPIALLFLSILILPIIMDIKSKTISHVFIAYIAYLFIAGTNPLLLSSTGMIVLVYVFSETYNKYYKPNELRRSSQ